VEEFCRQARGRLITVPSNGSDGQWSRATFCNTTAVSMLQVWITGDCATTRQVVPLCALSCGAQQDRTAAAHSPSRPALAIHAQSLRCTYSAGVLAGRPQRACCQPERLCGHPRSRSDKELIGVLPDTELLSKGLAATSVENYSTGYPEDRRIRTQASTTIRRGRGPTRPAAGATPSRTPP